MSGYKNFAIVGTGLTGSFIVCRFLKEKAARTANQVIVLTHQVSFVAVTRFPMHPYPVRQGSNTTIDSNAKLILVDYSDKESIMSALAGINVIISTIASVALRLQAGIAKAAKEVGVKLFIPSEFRGPTEGATEGLFGTKASVQDQLKAVGIPYALFYTRAYANIIWAPYAASFLMSLLWHSTYCSAGS